MLALWTFALLAYSNSFRAGFVFDNDSAILRDFRVHAATSENVNLILTEEYWYKTMTAGLYRPLTTFSYLFNYAILGNGPHSAGYHWVNFALHAVNIALVYLLGLLLLQQMDPRGRLAFALAAVWALHPVLTESVTNIVGRADLLAGFGVLAGLLCHVQGAAASGWRKLAWLLALMLATTIGIFSKESAVVVLAAMVIYDLTFGTAAPRSHSAWRARAPGYLALAVSFSVFFYARDQVFAKLPTWTVPFVDNPLVGADFWTARLTAVKVIGKYLWLLLWPSRLSCDYSYNQIPLFTWRFNNWEDWKTLAALAACAALAAVAMVCYRRSKPGFFFIAFFFAALAPTSNLAILIGSIMAERFLYLPSIGFAGCVVLAVYTVCRRFPARWLGARTAAPAALALICVAFAARTYTRNFDWFDDQSLWTSAGPACPASYKPHTYLAYYLILAKEADLDRAIHEAERSLAIVDRLPDEQNTLRAYLDAGLCYRLKGDTLASNTPQSGYWHQKALDALLRGERIDLTNNQVARRANLAHGMRIPNSGSSPLYVELGRAYMRVSDFRKAIEAFEYGRTLRPDAEFFEEMPAAYRALGDPQQAAIALMEGLVVDSSHTQFASELVELYQQTAPQSCAIRDAGGSVSLNLDCPLVHSQLCTASRNVALMYRQMGQELTAATTARSAIRDLGCPVQLFQ
jgi:tetratricopeptide (TPR) repeat protein